MLAVGVDGAGDERRLGTQRQRHRVEGVVERAHGRRLGDLAGLGGGGVLTLGQAVDAVVEQQDRHVHVTAQRVDQVVATDRERVAVTGDDPHRQVGARGRDAGRDRRRTSVDRVHAVGLEVVGEPRRAADAGDEHDVLPAQAEIGQEALHGLEYGVVAAARAPADLLVAGEVLAGLGLLGRRHQLDAAAHHRLREVGGGHLACSLTTVSPHTPSGASMPSASATRSAMAWARSAAFSGMPLTWL